MQQRSSLHFRFMIPLLPPSFARGWGGALPWRKPRSAVHLHLQRQPPPRPQRLRQQKLRSLRSMCRHGGGWGSTLPSRGSTGAQSRPLHAFVARRTLCLNLTGSISRPSTQGPILGRWKWSTSLRITLRSSSAAFGSTCGAVALTSRRLCLTVRCKVGTSRAGTIDPEPDPEL